jgi:Ankyrin repeats (3 copies)/Ankyrin repeats (many copies)
MKTSRLPCYLFVGVIGTAVVFGPVAVGQETTEMLEKALALVQQVEKPTEKAPTDAARVDLLSQAIKMAQEAPNHRLKGHRVLAIQSGDADHKAAGYLQNGEAELSASIALAGGTEAPTPTTDAKTVKMTGASGIQAAARAGDLEKVKAFVAGDPALVSSTVDDTGTTPLLAAGGQNHTDVVKFLLSQNAAVNAKDCLEMTALSHAAVDGHMEVAELLLAAKADPNLGDDRNLRPLFNAALMGRKEMVELLLAHGANVNAKGAEGSLWAGVTPLYIAACNGSANVVEVLLAHGAEVNAKGRDGLTPLQIAVKNHHNTPEVPQNDAASLLRAHGGQ